MKNHTAKLFAFALALFLTVSVEAKTSEAFGKKITNTNVTAEEVEAEYRSITLGS